MRYITVDGLGQRMLLTFHCKPYEKILEVRTMIHLFFYFRKNIWYKNKPSSTVWVIHLGPITFGCYWKGSFICIYNDLGWKYNTQNAKLYGECWRFAMYIHCYWEDIKYWVKLLDDPPTKYHRKYYNTMLLYDSQWKINSSKVENISSYLVTAGDTINMPHILYPCWGIDQQTL